MVQQTPTLSPFWQEAQRRGDAAAKREAKAERRRAQSPRAVEFQRLCAESRKAAGLDS